jgi:hypothetical protein
MVSLMADCLLSIEMMCTKLSMVELHREQLAAMVVS